MHKTGHFIAGNNHIDNGRSINIYNPNDGSILDKITSATDESINKAIESSLKAFEEWKNVSISKRSEILYEFKILLEKNILKIADLITHDLGKVKEDAIAEVRRGIENVEYAYGIGEILKGEHNKNVSSSIDSWSEFEPLGVVLGITPFNFPSMVPLWMFPLAIAAGNSFILKPSEKDPLASIFIAKLFNQTPAPKGLLNVLNGDKEVVEKLLVNKNIKAVSFVGSTPVAKSVYKKSSEYGKRCQSLGGAKNHAMVLPDANIDYSTNQIISAAFGSSGQRCMALSVVMVFSEIKQKFLKSLTKKVSNLKVGLDIQESNSFGPLVSSDHREKVMNYIELSQKEGCEVILDGRDLLKGKNSNKGYHLGPTIIDKVSNSMKSYKNEIFGPVLQVIEIENINEGIKIINENEFGNGCCIFTSNGQYARKFSNNVDIGMVGINIPLPVPSSYHSFGGWKNSFFGDLGIYGPDGLRFYTNRKTITQKWPETENEKSKIDLSMPNN